MASEDLLTQVRQMVRFNGIPIQSTGVILDQAITETNTIMTTQLIVRIIQRFRTQDLSVSMGFKVFHRFNLIKM